MLKARRLDEGTVQKAVGVIERNVKTQIRLVEDLLDVSRIVADKLRLDRRRINLVHVIEAAIESAKAPADAKFIRIDAYLNDVACEVLGDPDRLQQVVSNLLTNAVKFTPVRGRVSVRLKRERTAAMIQVEDTGCGISPELLPHVFDRFRQAASVTTRSHGGLGLGLTIVCHLVGLHGGTVKAESQGQGRGATFTVTLPLVSAECSVVAVESRKIPWDGSSIPVVLDGVRVLLVDDEGDARELIEAVLRASGADVHATQSARGALVELEAFGPHVLLSDIGMPEEDGYTLIRKVRAHESTGSGHVQAVALTAFASQMDCEQAITSGFDAHIAKPASPGDLVRTVAMLVGRAA
jgi:CheY-like chemotaxis protein